MLIAFAAILLLAGLLLLGLSLYQNDRSGSQNAARPVLRPRRRMVLRAWV